MVGSSPSAANIVDSNSSGENRAGSSPSAKRSRLCAPTPAARETFAPAAEAHPARSEQAAAEAGIVKVADEIVREDYRSAPPVHPPRAGTGSSCARCRACPGSQLQACTAAGQLESPSDLVRLNPIPTG